MKKMIKKSISLMLSVIIAVTALCISPFMVQAVDTAGTLDSQKISFWADPEKTIMQEDINAFESGTKTTMVGAVGAFKRSASSEKYYLFLPSNADCTNLKVWFTAESASVNGTPVKNGQATDVFKDVNAGGISEVYTLNLGSSSYSLTVMKSGDVATVYIDTESGSIKSINASDDKSVSETGTIMVVNTDGTIEYDGALEKISGRGNGTWSTTNTKNPYNIKLAASTRLLGMNKAKKWCLLANTSDYSLIKNQLTYDFADYIGVKFQPHCKPVDLYVNQQYFGSYQLSEKVEIKSNRINVTDAYENLEIANGTADPSTGVMVPADLSETKVQYYTASTGRESTVLTTLASATYGHTTGNKKYSTSLNDPSDYTGGYLYELEISNRWLNENAGFCAYNRQGWVLKSCDFATKNMVNYSYDLLYALGASVYNNGIVPSSSTNQPGSSLGSIGSGSITGTSNPAPAAEYQGKKWSDILDADSAVRYYWTQEYFKNMDSSTSSTYFYKDSDSIDSKLYAGPLWDMDNSIGYDLNGSRWGLTWTEPTNWYTKSARMYRYKSTDSSTDYTSDNDAPLNFYAALATNCDDFWQMAQNYWYSRIEPATKILLGEETDPNGVLHSTEYYASTVAKSATMNNLRHHLNDDAPYDNASVASGINNWFTQRNNWINSQFGKISITDCTVSSIPTQICTGSPIEPEITVSYNNVTLEKGVDYELSYSNNVSAGKTACATITGIGRYTGSVDKSFTINSGSLLSCTASIPENAYSDDTISVSVVNANGVSINQFINYQWYADSVAISGATQESYTVASEYAGQKITVRIQGDGTNFASVGITSNECNILEGTRPTGYSKTIASWDYDYTSNADALVNADTTGTSYYYMATGGENAATAELTASVNAKDKAEIKWSGNADVYVNSSVMAGTDQSPVMGTSKTNSLAWGQFPYFETTVSTLGYENIQFSAKLGGTKKGPRDWKLQYSLDGINYTDIDGASYSITNNKNMEQAFSNVILPAECENQSKIYIRAVVSADVAISGVNAIITSTSGDASINNIKITGASTAVISSLEAPSFETDTDNEDTAMLFDSDNVIIKDNNGGADIYYSINGSQAVLYTGPFNPFDSKTANQGDTATITAFANFNDISSEISSFDVTFAGVNISQFSYDNYSSNVSNGSVFSSGGVYGESGKMSAYTDSSYQYVPLWNDSNKAFCVAPDDSLKWTAQSGFYFEISTAGYKNISFTCKAYTTAYGPNSVSLQYSTNAEDWIDVKQNVQLNANDALEQIFMTCAFPAECSNLTKLYVRLITAEDKTHGSAASPQTTLHNNASKGNFYINDVVISGEDDGTYKMPYTNKTTNYFGTGTIKYNSPDNIDMQYIITNSKSSVIQSGSYPATGISLTAVEGFDPTTPGPYTISIWAGDSDDKSLVNTRSYYYKGETVVEFNYNDSTRALSNYLNTNLTAATNTAGANSGTLSMYPNASAAAVLSYTDVYGVKVSWASDNTFKATKQLNNPAGNGYWLVETSSKGYTDLTLNLEQLSSNKGPRDWGLAYSTDGENYIYVEDSNARAISNDASPKTVETYNNISLPAECNDKDKLYIKIFINGGESVDGEELETLLKGNTGINDIVLSGIAIPKATEVTFNTVALENRTDSTGTYPVDAVVSINGVDYATTNGQVTVELDNGAIYTASAAVNKTFANDVEFTAADGANITIALVCVDMNGDGVINVKDFVLISRIQDNDKKEQYTTIFRRFMNVKSKSFNYTK